jgi:hypothetical protein
VLLRLDVVARNPGFSQSLLKLRALHRRVGVLLRLPDVDDLYPAVRLGRQWLPAKSDGLDARVVADELDGISFRIRDEQGPPVEARKFLWTHLHTQPFQLMPPFVVILQADHEGKVVDRGSLAVDLDIAVEENECLWVPFDAVGDPEEHAVRVLSPDLEPDDVPIERQHLPEVVDAQGELSQEPYRLSRHRITPVSPEDDSPKEADHARVRLHLLGPRRLSQSVGAAPRLRLRAFAACRPHKSHE